MATVLPSQFADVDLAKPVVIFKLTADCKADTSEKKIDLGVGGVAYIFAVSLVSNLFVCPTSQP